MTKKTFKRFKLDVADIKSHKYLKIFGTLLNDPNLWHLNRYSVATAFSVGLFFAFVPIPFHMILAAAVAILVRSNLPISVALVWLTNPLTMAPIFYFTFKIGTWILGRPPTEFHFEPSLHWLTTGLKSIWTPLLLGSFICGTLLAIISNITIRLSWRYRVNRNWKARKKRQKFNNATMLPYTRSQSEVLEP